MVILRFVLPGTLGRIACCYSSALGRVHSAHLPAPRRAALRSQPSWNAHATAIMTNDETFSFFFLGRSCRPDVGRKSFTFLLFLLVATRKFPGRGETNAAEGGASGTASVFTLICTRCSRRKLDNSLSCHVRSMITGMCSENLPTLPPALARSVGRSDQCSIHLFVYVLERVTLNKSVM